MGSRGGGLFVFRARTRSALRSVSSPRRPAVRSAALILIAGSLICLETTPAVAQQFGQWWWEGAVAGGQRSTDNFRDGSQVSEFDQTETRLSLALNGFLGHPALGTFRLGVDLLKSEIDGGRGVDTDRAGFAADLGLFPEGAYPLRLFARTRLYDYSGSSARDPLTVLRAPDRTTEWGGRFRLRRSALRGLQLGFDHSTTDFIDREAQETTYDHQYLDWGRGGGGFQHHVKLGHRLYDYGAVDLEVEDFTVNVVERGDLSATWRWDMSATGVRRDSATRDAAMVSTDMFSLFNRFLHTIRDRDRLDIQLDSDVTRPESQPSVDSHGVSVFYRWRPKEGLEIAPFGQYAEQSADSLEVRSPRVGTAISWSRHAGALDTLLSARASYGVVDQSDALESRDESRTAFGVSGSLGHGDGNGLRKELEVEVARNEFRFDRNPFLDLPDLGLPLTGLGAEDFQRARVGLSHRWDSRSLGGWGEWNRRESSNGVPGFEFESQTSTFTLQHGGPNYDIQASAGDTAVDRGSVEAQDVSYLGATATWRPWRLLKFWGSYREDTRELTITPDIDGKRIQAGFTLRVGQIVLEASAYETEERPADGVERSNEGLSWSVSRRFAGWLPVVTGSKHRGVIR
jgi:hypothetical protein